MQGRGHLAELKIEIDQADPLTRLGREIASQVRSVERLAAAATGGSHGEHLGEMRALHHDTLGNHGQRRGAGRSRDIGDVERTLQGVGELTFACRVLDQLDGAGPDNVAQVGLGLRPQGQDDGRYRRGGSQAGQPGHAGVTVEHGSGHQHVDRSLFVDLLDHVDHIAACDHVIPGTKRGLDGSAQSR
jgi:hypothetical protein